MIRVLIAAAACLLWSTVAAGQSLTAEPVVLDPAAPERITFDRLTYRGGLALTGDDGFGGLSSLLFDGSDLVAINDNAHWFRLRLHRNGEGWLDGAALVEQGRLLGPDGRPLDGKRMSDSESSTPWQGGILVGFERHHRLWHYAPNLRSLPRPLDVPPGIAALPPNGGIEAMASLPDGRQLLISERGGDDREASAWIGAPGNWRPFGYRRDGQFRPTGATALPDGRIFVVERRFTIVGGAAGRVVGGDATALMSGGLEELLRLEPPLTVDNFEGIAARAEDGRTVIYIVSDDNMSPWQKTLLLSFELRP